MGIAALACGPLNIHSPNHHEFGLGIALPLIQNKESFDASNKSLDPPPYQNWRRRWRCGLLEGPRKNTVIQSKMLWSEIENETDILDQFHPAIDKQWLRRWELLCPRENRPSTEYKLLGPNHSFVWQAPRDRYCWWMVLTWVSTMVSRYSIGGL